MNIHIPAGWQPKRLFVNGSAYALNPTVRIDDAGQSLDTIIGDYFVINLGQVVKMRENAYTIEFHKEERADKSLYYTVLDNKLTVSNEVRFIEPIPSEDVFEAVSTGKRIAETVDERTYEVREYKIYHMTNPDWTLPTKEQQLRHYVGSVRTTSLDGAYQASQNLNSAWKDHCRSTSIGDVIEEDGILYMVVGPGFKMLPGAKFSDTGTTVSEEELEKYEEGILNAATAGRKLDS